MECGPVEALRTDNPEWAAKFEKRLPHFFIGIVAFQDITPEVYQSHMLWMAHVATRLKGKARLSLGVACRKEQYRARNYIVHHAQLEGADFLLMVDDDQTLHECPEMLERFFKNGKEIQGGLYFQRGGCYHPVVMKQIHGTAKAPRFRFYHPDELPKEFAQVDVLGGGLNFIEMSVFDRMKEPHWRLFHDDEYDTIFTPNPDFGMDVDFCMKAGKLGYTCWLDPSIEVGHVSHSREVVNSASRPPQEEIAKSAHYQQYMVGVAGAGVNPT
jgi:hypothetical protein